MAIAEEIAYPGRAQDAERGLSRLVPSIYQVSLAAILGGIFIVGLAPRLDPDLWWHLRSGSWILSHGAVPGRDPFSWTFAGRRWTDHEWLSQVAMDASFRIAGLWGPLVLFAVAVTSTFGLVYTRMVRMGINRILSLFVMAAGFVACSPILGARPQMVTLAFLAVFVLLLERFVDTGNVRLLIPLPLLMLVWANSHGGFVLGLVLIAIFLMGESLNRFTRRTTALLPSSLWALALVLAASAASTLVNPSGAGQALYPLELATPNAYTNHLNEWVSPDFHLPQFMVFELLLLALIASTFAARSRLNWSTLALTLTFTHLALNSGRNIAVWVILLTPVLARQLQSAATAVHEQLPRRAVYRGRPVRGRLRPVLNLSLLGMVAVLYVLEGLQYIGPAALQRNERDTFPSGAVAYLRVHQLPPHVFASYSWGGYILWKAPRYMDFIDGRANTVFDARILYDYFDAYSAAPGWAGILARRSVQDVLIEPWAPLAQALSGAPGWTRVYHDSRSVLFTRSATA